MKDTSGRIIYLTDERLAHIGKHPEMQDKFSVERMKETLTKPDIIISDKYTENKHMYYLYYKEKKQYLLVSVKYLNGEGFIITSFYTDNAK